MRLQHNIMAKSSYRNYKNNVSALKKNLEKLSSGYKVNRAADDAAGLAISEKMRAQITGEETAQKNARDGISLVQTAEGALTEVHDILDRMVELATQSANGTYDDDTDRYQLQKEMSLLLDEINRIADSSNFNGIPLLDGSMDAGGDTVFTSGSFQINNSTLHPAGLDTGSIELPDVGRTLGTDTVLHTEGARGGDTNAFSIDLENLSLKAGKTIEITFGDVTVTVENSIPEGGTGTAASARDIIAAIENKVKGTNEGNINVIFSGAAAATGSDGSKVLKIGNTEFKLTASGTRLTFTQTSKDAGIEMPREVTVTDPSALKVKGKPNIDTVQKPNTSTPAKYKIDLTSVDVSSPGKVTIALLGEQFDFEISDDDFKNKGNVSIGKLLAERLTKALEDANLAPDPVAGAVTFTNNQDGTITVDFADPGEPEYDLRGISVTTVAYLDGETRTGIDEDVQFTFDVDSWDGEFDGGILTPKTVTVTVDGEEYVFTFVPALTGAKNEIVIHQGDDIKELIQKKLMEVVAEKNKEKRAENKSYNDVNTGSIEFDSNSWTLKYKYVEQEYIGISDGSDGSGGSGGSGGTEKTSEGFTGDYNKSTTVLETRSGSTQDRLASTWFDLSKLADSEGHIAEGTTITIGRDTYTFTYDASKIGKDGYVVLNGGEDPDDLATAAGKLTKAAEHNGTYTVGFDEEYDDGRGRITVTERENQTYFDLTTMEGIEKSLGFKNASTTPASGAKGLTLQIGDTDDVYSKLNVSIKDCHALALGIADISIARQADAAGAVNAIRAAINYVSDVRGTLGAAQNRLDHTINNLSVMAENIQDAESTIRDADIAEEMMAYTKNNILIQSAQAMLAQANQVPQGVLQLLQ